MTPAVFLETKPLATKLLDELNDLPPHEGISPIQLGEYVGGSVKSTVNLTELPAARCVPLGRVGTNAFRCRTIPARGFRFGEIRVLPYRTALALVWAGQLLEGKQEDHPAA